METRRYSLGQEPANSVYVGLLQCALRFCQLGLVVVRPDAPLSPRAASVVERLGAFIHSSTVASEWPGTQLLGGATAQVHLFFFNPQTLSIITESSTKLYAWVQPELPEDLCLLKDLRQPWLVSIAHERDAYLDLDETEHAQVTALVPGLRIRPDQQGW